MVIIMITFSDEKIQLEVVSFYIVVYFYFIEIHYLEKFLEFNLL